MTRDISGWGHAGVQITALPATCNVQLTLVTDSHLFVRLIVSDDKHGSEALSRTASTILDQVHQQLALKS